MTIEVEKSKKRMLQNTQYVLKYSGRYCGDPELLNFFEVSRFTDKVYSPQECEDRCI